MIQNGTDGRENMKNIINFSILQVSTSLLEASCHGTNLGALRIGWDLKLPLLAALYAFPLHVPTDDPHVRILYCNSVQYTGICQRCAPS
jgi:hypothetical protein